MKRLETCWSQNEPMSEPQTDGDHYVGGGRLVATFTDLDGDVLGLIQG